MPSAIQYGIPLDAFWYGDLRLLDAYKKAYLRDVSFRAWKIGDYMCSSVYIGVHNALAAKKSELIKEWITFKDPIEKLERKTPISKENIEVEFRRRQAQDNAFVQKILHRS